MKIKKMKISAYDWFDLEKAVEEKSGKLTRDWAGRGKNQPTDEDYKTGNYPTAKWAIEQGYDWTVLNDPSLLPDSEGMNLRIKINTEYRLVEKERELPYQDFWHYALDNIFYEIHNGCICYFNPKDALTGVDDLDSEGNSQEWVREILRCFIEVMKENKMKDEVEVWISW